MALVTRFYCLCTHGALDVRDYQAEFFGWQGSEGLRIHLGSHTCIKYNQAMELVQCNHVLRKKDVQYHDKEQ